ncbi:hypothetical protein P775_12140 [Puniceibacterium antarcticum]|uniref:Uncharacterized protein n=1 Tax=Puniceibacterium antarcticum TaxID=1206336 RepID=A0A2G8RFS6_9RHOB|nr:alpha/beta hydrolase [Puniceibacterium antarcticum]PIL19928.1 hypothetical protein P775_12140 [Puniceibacterium antarcticum]
MINTLLIPRLYGFAAPHWQQWWERVDSSGRIVRQKSWSRPCPGQWLTEIAVAVLVHPGAGLVGHSGGTIAIVRVLTQSSQIKIASALLVAPAETSKAVRTEVFGMIHEAGLGVLTIVAASQNVSWTDHSRVQVLAVAWEADMIAMGDTVHINVESGFRPLSKSRTIRDSMWALPGIPQRFAGPVRSGTPQQGGLTCPA